MPGRSRSYDDSLAEDLRDPAEAAAYLRVALDEAGDPDGTALLAVALGNVLRAQPDAAELGAGKPTLPGHA